MLMCLGRCNCNYAEARRLYQELYARPRNSALPSAMAFRRLHFRMYNTGSVHGRDQYRVDLNMEYGDRWIGRGGPVNWPARSPDLTPLDFFLWGAVKQFVFKKTCDTEPEMRLRIEAAFNELKTDASVLRRVRANMIKRCNKCLEQEGGHIEQHLSNREVDVIIN